MNDASPRVVLASGSAVRAKMLRDAGVKIVVDPAGIDESMIKAMELAQNAAPNRIAAALAEAKSRKVSCAHPGSLVIGADQVMTLNGQIYDKPADIDEARRHLVELRGQPHQQVSAVCVARDDGVLWRGVDAATVHMRMFTLAFLENYLKAAGDAVLSSVGCYQIEGIGAQLIERIDGDHFTVKGLPLFPLLSCLRAEGVLAA